MATEEQRLNAVATITDPSSYRDSEGRFVKGYGGGPGRVSVRKAHEYLDVFLGKCTLERWGEVVDMALDDATSESIAARRYGREWLSRIIFPAIEKVLVASISVSIETGDSNEIVRRLVDMLLPTLGAVVDSTASTVDDK